MDSLLRETQELWSAHGPKKPLFSSKLPEKDAHDDAQVPAKDKRALLYKGQVVWAMFARAFFPAYVPGRNTHYGSVVYSVTPHAPYSVFEMVYRLSELRDGSSLPPHGTEEIAAALNDDESNFSRLRLPSTLGAQGEWYFANVCIHRSRLPLGYLHDRLVPILIAPAETEWCCILPLRYWAPKLKDLWGSGPPAHPPSRFTDMMQTHGVEP